jgi:hypothetical protein
MSRADMILRLPCGQYRYSTAISTQTVRLAGVMARDAGHRAVQEHLHPAGTRRLVVLVRTPPVLILKTPPQSIYSTSRYSRSLSTCIDCCGPVGANSARCCAPWLLSRLRSRNFHRLHTPI